jgi:hypothetical protein
VDAIIVPGGITINNAAAVVTLQGLHVSAAGGGLHGIRVQAAAVHIRNCTVERMLGSGISVEFNNAEIFISDTVSRDNGADGLVAVGGGGPVEVTIHNSLFENNGNNGVHLQGAVGTISGVVTSGNASDGIRLVGGQMTVTDTIAAHNGAAGFQAAERLEATQMTLQSVVGHSNTGEGVVVYQSTARVSASVFTNNTTGILNIRSAVFTRQDNLVSGNTTNTSGTLTPLAGI